SVDSSNLSLIVQNKKCFDNDIVCSKDMLLTIGDSEIFFSESLDIEGMLRRHGEKSKYQVWKAGYYVAIHFPEEEFTVLWDRKTTMHIKVGARWKGKLAGLCGNFDKFTSNDLTTSNNMEVKNAQIFGESWTIGQIDVTSFVKNCHTDTCNCNLGGDCECLCTSIAAYAHKCCQQGAVIHWRSPSLCPYDCDYYNQASSLISLECAERPNYFLYVHNDNSIFLAQWDASLSFRRRTTFIHHQGLWISSYNTFELHSKRGFFLTLSTSAVKISKFDGTEEFKSLSSFSIEGELHIMNSMQQYLTGGCVNGDMNLAQVLVLKHAMILKEQHANFFLRIAVKPTESSFGTKPARTNPTMLSSQITNISGTFSQMPITLITEETEPTYVNLYTKITTEPKLPKMLIQQ
ncbi:hypothetical protein E2320_003866, partial [Naja naja]